MSDFAAYCIYVRKQQHAKQAGTMEAILDFAKQNPKLTGGVVGGTLGLGGGALAGKPLLGALLGAGAGVGGGALYEASQNRPPGEDPLAGAPPLSGPQTPLGSTGNVLTELGLQQPPAEKGIPGIQLDPKNLPKGPQDYVAPAGRPEGFTPNVGPTKNTESDLLNGPDKPAEKKEPDPSKGVKPVEADKKEKESKYLW